MKELKLYREDNGQYSTSEAKQDDVSGAYVQRTGYDELRTEHYDRRAKVQDLEKENAELRSWAYAVKEQAGAYYETGFDEGLLSAIDSTPAQHLADIKADEK